MSDYILSPALHRAVEIALHLNKPLLLSGEPGTGKTSLAKHLAETYSQHPPAGYAPFFENPYTFDTKTISVATDLFYSYDALGRLRDATVHEKKEIGEYIELKALGRAIVNKHGLPSRGLDKIRSIRDFRGRDENAAFADPISSEPRSSIVLIDEIDKATRDFPNDLLNEIEHMEFYIREIDAKVSPADNNAKILVIMTSNNEKNLPDAFLRRCIFHHIEFPGEKQLDAIIRAHFPQLHPTGNGQVMGIIKTFNELRRLPLLKKPATAEFMDWLRVLERDGLLEEAARPYEGIPDAICQQLKDSLSVLVKNNSDIGQVEEAIKNM